MSYETINTAETEERVGASGNSDGEYINPHWDDSQLFGLVSANQDVLVRVHWMCDAEMTVSDAIKAHPGPWIPENEPNLISDVNQLLANRVEKAEEEEDEPEEESDKTKEADSKANAKTNDRQEQRKPHSNEAEKQTKKEDKAPKPSEQATIKAEKSIISEGNRTQKSEAEVPSGFPAGSGKMISADSPDKLETLAIINNKSESSAPGTVVNKSKEVPGYAQTTADHGSEFPTAPKAIVTAKPKFTELQAIDVEDMAVAELDDKEELAEDESLLTTLDDETEPNDLIDFVEDETLFINLAETDEPPFEDMYSGIDTSEIGEDVLGPGEEVSISQLRDESNFASQIEQASSEKFVETSLAVEEIEDSLLELAERIEASEPETAEVVNALLDKIIEAPAKLETDDEKNIITETEVQEELEELFTELLVKLDIDYTPELIESLAHLTLKLHLVEEIELLKNEEINGIPQGSGTHEIIKRLMTGISNIKKSIANTYAIGKSALRFYNLKYLTS